MIVLDDDVVVRKELNGLWDLNLKGNVVGAVGLQESDGFCGERELGDYLNYSNPILSSPSLGIHRNQCAWSWGVNVFDLKAWRRTDITQTYQFWLRKASCSSPQQSVYESKQFLNSRLVFTNFSSSSCRTVNQNLCCGKWDLYHLR